MAFGQVGVTAVIDGMSAFQSNANKFSSAIGKMTSSVGKVGSTILPIGKVLGFFGEQIDRVLTIAGGILVSRIAYNLVDTFTSIGTSAIDATATLQMYEVGLSGLIARSLLLEKSNGDLSESIYTISDVMPEATAKTKEFMDSLATLAIKSPYELEKVIEVFRQAMAFKFSPTQAESFTRSVLTMSAGLGLSNEQLERVGYNLGQIRSQEKITALDVRQLALAGVDLNDILKYTAKALGYNIDSYEEFNDLLAEGKVTWADFTKSFEEYSTKVFGGAAERMAMTLMGLKSTFKDIFVLTIPKMLEGMIEKITLFAGRLVGVITNLRDSKVLEDIGARLSETFQIPPVAEKIMSWLERYTEALKRLSDAKVAGDTQGIEDMGRALEDLAPGGKVLEGLIRYVFGEPGVQALNTFTTVLKISAAIISTLFKVIGQVITGDFYGALETLHVPDNVIAFIHDIEKALGNLKTFWDQNGPGIVGIFSSFFEQATKAPTSGQTGLGGFFITLTQSLIDNGPKIQETLQQIADWVLNTALPALERFSNWFLTEGLPSISRFFDWINSNWETIVAVAAVILTLGAAFSFVGQVVGTLLSILPTLIPFLAVIQEVGGVGAAISLSLGPLAGLLPIIGQVGLALMAVVTIVGLLAAAFATNFMGFRDAVMAVWTSIVETLQPAFDRLREAWDTLVIALQPLIALFNEYLLPVLQVLGQVLLGVVVVAIMTVIGVLVGLVNGIVTAVTFIVTALGTLITGWTQTFQGIEKIVQAFVLFLQGIWKIIQGDWEGAAKTFNESFKTQWEGLKLLFEGTWNSIVGFLQLTFGTLLGLVGGFIGGVIEFFTTLADKLVGHSIIPDMMKDVVAAVTDGLNKTLEDAKTFVQKFLDFGKSLIQSVIDGIKDMTSGLIRTISDTLTGAIQAAKDALQMHSPSKPFVDIGEGMMESIQKGISALSSLPELAITSSMTHTLAAAGSMVQAAPALPISNTSNISNQTTYSVQATYPMQSARRVSDDLRLLQLQGSV